jgi:hypothetical protein
MGPPPEFLNHVHMLSSKRNCDYSPFGNKQKEQNGTVKA